MPQTSASLLDRLRDSPDADSWQQLVNIYTPMIRSWLRRQSMTHPEDADDLVQEVLAVVVRRVGVFRRERTGSFRAWLRQVTVNVLRDFWKSRRLRPAASGGSEFLQVLDQLEDPASGISKLWDEEHDRHVTRRLMDLIRPRFEEKTWQAFQRVAIDGNPPDRVAAELGISVNAVFIAKSRVLSKLRQEGDGLLD